MSPTTPTFSTADLVLVLRRHAGLSILAAVAMLALAVLVILFAPRKYSSSAEYLVRLGRESVALDPVATVGETMGIYMTSDSIVKSTQQIFGSDTFANRVIDRAGVDLVLEVEDDGTPPSLASRVVDPVKDWVAAIDPISLKEKAKIKFRESLEVRVPAQSNVISVSYVSKSPQQCFDVLKIVSDVFLEEHSRINYTDGSFPFFEEQNAILATELDRAAAELKEAKQLYGISSIEGKRRDLETRLSQSEANRQDIERKLSSSLSRIDQLQSQLSTTPETIVLAANEGNDQQSGAAVMQQLVALQVSEKGLSSRLKPGHPKYAGVQKQLTDVQEMVESMNLSETQTSRGSNPIHQQLSLSLMNERAEQFATQSEAEVIGQQIAQLNEELKQLNVQETEIFHLQTNLDVLEDRYKSHASKLEQARLENALRADSITSIGIIQYPSLNERPAFPNKKLVALFGLVAAVGSAVSLPFLMEFLRPSLPFRDMSSGDGNLAAALSKPSDRAKDGSVPEPASPSWIASAGGN